MSHTSNLADVLPPKNSASRMVNPKGCHLRPPSVITGLPVFPLPVYVSLN